jgi:hypothetical protein
MLTRAINGVAFEFESPCLFRPLGLPVEIRFMGGHWRVTLLWHDQFTSGDYPTREAAIAVVTNGIGAQ